MKSVPARALFKLMPKPLRTWIYSIREYKIKALAIVILGLVVIVAGFFAASVLKTKLNKEVYFNDSNSPASTYSLGGVVKKINLPNLDIEVGQVVTDSKGNTLTYKTY